MQPHLPTGFFGLNGPDALFKKAQNDMVEFHESPNEWNLFNLLCTLNHLRDWICPGGWKSYRDITEVAWTPAQRFHRQLHDDDDFIIVRDLCNNAKHFIDAGVGTRTRTIDGARAGLLRAGDRLDQRYYLVDGKDLRIHIFGLMSKYCHFFCTEQHT